MQKSKSLRYEINSSTLSTIIYALEISEIIEWADEKRQQRASSLQFFNLHLRLFLYHNYISFPINFISMSF